MLEAVYLKDRQLQRVEITEVFEALFAIVAFCRGSAANGRDGYGRSKSPSRPGAQLFLSY
ncbi:MAG: hypothetical protein ACRDI1_01495 [Actinomycetota bacterium]